MGTQGTEPRFAATESGTLPEGRALVWALETRKAFDRQREGKGNAGPGRARVEEEVLPSKLDTRGEEEVTAGEGKVGPRSPGRGLMPLSTSLRHKNYGHTRKSKAVTSKHHCASGQYLTSTQSLLVRIL